MEIGIQEIRTLVELLDQSSVGELTFEQGSSRLVLKKTGGSPVVVAAPVGTVSPPSVPLAVEPVSEPVPAPLEPSCFVQQAPMVGTFYAAPAPEAPPYVQVGDRVQAGQVLCIIEAMKLMNEIESEAAGIIRAVRVKNATPVDFGQPLFEIEGD